MPVSKKRKKGKRKKMTSRRYSQIDTALPVDEGVQIEVEDTMSLYQLLEEREQELMAESPDYTVDTQWNGIPIVALRGTAIVAPSPQFPEFWGNELVGERIEVVRADLNGANFDGGIDYLDNRDGEGWRKVTEGHGGPAYPHKNLGIIPGSFEMHKKESK